MKFINDIKEDKMFKDGYNKTSAIHNFKQSIVAAKNGNIELAKSLHNQAMQQKWGLVWDLQVARLEIRVKNAIAHFEAIYSNKDTKSLNEGEYYNGVEENKMKLHKFHKEDDVFCMECKKSLSGKIGYIEKCAGGAAAFGTWCKPHGVARRIRILKLKKEGLSGVSNSKKHQALENLKVKWKQMLDGKIMEAATARYVDAALKAGWTIDELERVFFNMRGITFKHSPSNKNPEIWNQNGMESVEVFGNAKGKKFGIKDVGMYADGTHGDLYVSQKTIAIAEDFGFNPKPYNKRDDLDEIAGEAIDYLNEHAVQEGVHFVFAEGDLLLLKRARR